MRLYTRVAKINNLIRLLKTDVKIYAKIRLVFKTLETYISNTHMKIYAFELILCILINYIL